MSVLSKIFSLVVDAEVLDDNPCHRVKKLRAASERVRYLSFPSPKTGGRVNDVGRQFERAVKNAKIVDFHFHDLRHTAATRMADAGADPFTLAAILGHSDIRMTARYTHATDEAKRRAVENLVVADKIREVWQRIGNGNKNGE